MTGDRPDASANDRIDEPGREHLRDDAPQLIGQAAGGSHIYYDERDRTMFEGPAPDELGHDDRANEQPVGTRGVEGIVDAVNDREGWDWLSEFAREHVPLAGNDDGDASNTER